MFSGKPGKLFVLIMLSFFSAYMAADSLEESGNAELYAAGEEIYDQACVMCHSKDPAKSNPPALNLYQLPKDDQQQFFLLVINGKGIMPAFSDYLTHQEILQLWIFVSNSQPAEE